MKFNNNNSSIINYAFKVLCKKELTDNAKKYWIKKSMNLTIIYPYLLPLIDDFVFTPYNADKNIIEHFANIIYEESFKNFNYEGICYAIYYSLKYGFHLKSIDASKIIKMDSCLAKLFGMLYYKKYGNKKDFKLFRDDAKVLKETDMDRNWIYVYETLTFGNLCGEWKNLKKAGISFLKTEFNQMKFFN